MRPHGRMARFELCDLPFDPIRLTHHHQLPHPLAF